MKKGFLITLEGGDGCGKTTQSRLLADRLRAEGRPVLHTREPGGTDFAEALREIILSPAFKIHPVTEIFLYEASRAQHTEEVIRPALAENKTVVCERYADATVAYQGYGRGLDLKMVQALNAAATSGLAPDLTIYLDLPLKEAARRMADKKKDRLESEGEGFHARVRKGYLAIAKKEPRRFKVISSAGSVEAVGEAVWRAVQAKLGGRKNV